MSPRLLPRASPLCLHGPARTRPRFAARVGLLVASALALVAGCGGAPPVPRPVAARPAPPPAPPPRMRVVAALTAPDDDAPYEAHVDGRGVVPWMRDVTVGVAVNHDLRFRAPRPEGGPQGEGAGVSEGGDLFVDAARPTPRRNPWDLTGRVELVELVIEGEWGPSQERSQRATRWLVAEAIDLSGSARWPASVTGQRARAEAELARLATRHAPVLEAAARAQLRAPTGTPAWEVRGTRFEMGAATATYRSDAHRIALRQSTTAVVTAQRAVTAHRACPRCPRAAPCARCGTETRVEDAEARATLTATYLFAPDGGVALESLELPEEG